MLVFRTKSLLINSYQVFNGAEWKSFSQVEDFNLCTEASISFQNQLTNPDKKLVYMLNSCQTLKYLKIEFQNVNTISQHLQHTAAAIYSNVSLTRLDINLRAYRIKDKQIVSNILSCLKPPNLQILYLRFNEISDTVMNDFASGIGKLVNLTILHIEIEKGSQRESLFKGLKNLQQLQILKLNMKKDQFQIQRPSSKSRNVILPECKKLKLSIQDLQFFSSFKEYNNLKSLRINLISVTNRFLSQIIENQLPYLITVENLALIFDTSKIELIEFSCQAVQLLPKLNSLKIILNSQDQIDCRQLFSSIENNQNLRSLSIIPKVRDKMILSDINVNSFKNIRNLEFRGLSKPYNGQNDEEKVRIIKNLRRLDNLNILYISYRSDNRSILKSKRLVKLIQILD